MSTKYYPELWKIVYLNSNTPHYRIFASWHGGFVSGDSWKLSSGVEDFYLEDGVYVVPQTSGSIYYLVPNNEGTTGYTQGVLNSILKQYDFVELRTLETLKEKFRCGTT